MLGLNAIGNVESPLTELCLVQIKVHIRKKVAVQNVGARPTGQTCFTGAGAGEGVASGGEGPAHVAPARGASVGVRQVVAVFTGGAFGAGDVGFAGAYAGGGVADWGGA